MKIGGIIVAVLGCMLILSGLHLGFTQYDLSQTRDVSRFVGGLAFGILILAAGLVMIKKARSGRR